MTTRRTISVWALVLPLVILGVGAFLVWPEDRLDPDVRADFVWLEKSKRTLSLYYDDQVLKSYRVSLGRSPHGDKIRQGDMKTPEGDYVLDSRNPHSRYHLAIHVSYPDSADKAEAAELGVDPGGDIMIHGFPNNLGWLGALQKLHRIHGRWTAGCIAVTDAEMDEIWNAVPNGTPISIRP